MMANYLNECQTAGKNPSWSWDEKPLSSCDKRILQIAQKPIADAENTARKTVPKTRFLGDSSRDGKPIACAIWGCLGAINLSQPVGPSASRSAIQSDALSLWPKHPKPVSFLSSEAPPGSGLTPLNPTIAHTKYPHLDSIVALARFVIFAFPQEITRKSTAYDIDRVLILSNA
jgi:hypothetical protein